MNLTPSAISHSIAAMEREVGFQLFHRNKQGVELTSNGEALYPQIRQLLNNGEVLQQTIDQMNGLNKGTVKLGTFNSVCIHWIPEIVTSFQKKYPGITVEIFEGTYDDIINWLKTGAVDLGFLSTSCEKEMSMVPLYDDPLVCVVPKKLKTKHKDYITLDEMMEHMFVIQREACDADIQKFIQKNKLAVRSHCFVIDDQSTIAMVESGFGISIMPELTAQKAADQVNVYPIFPKDYRVIGLACFDKKALSPAAAQMYNHIVEMFRKKPVNE